jgi:hypothetical protein
MPQKVSALAKEAVYGVITEETIHEIFDRRMLTADLLTHSSDKQEAFAAFLVLQTLKAIREELEGRIG